LRKSSTCSFRANVSSIALTNVGASHRPRGGGSASMSIAAISGITASPKRRGSLISL